MFKTVLEKAEKPEIKLPTFAAHFWNFPLHYPMYFLLF